AGDWVRLVNLSAGRVRDGRIPEDRTRLEAAARQIARGVDPWKSDEDEAEALVDRIEADPTAEPSEAETSGRFLSVFAQTSGLLGTLESLLVKLQGVAGRKALVLISPGFPQLTNLDRELDDVATLTRQPAQ